MVKSTLERLYQFLKVPLSFALSNPFVTLSKSVQKFLILFKTVISVSFFISILLPLERVKGGLGLET